MSRNINRYWTAGLTALLWCIAVSVFSADQIASVSTTSPFATEQLRNPFWPVGYLPESWHTADKEISAAPAEDTSWDGPTSQLQVSGTSRMGSRMVAIVNGEMKSVGDLVEVHYNGRLYQWKIQDIRSDGTVNLERYAVRTDSAGLQPKGGK